MYIFFGCPKIHWCEAPVLWGDRSSPKRCFSAQLPNGQTFEALKTSENQKKKPPPLQTFGFKQKKTGYIFKQ